MTRIEWLKPKPTGYHVDKVFRRRGTVVHGLVNGGPALGGKFLTLYLEDGWLSVQAELAPGLTLSDLLEGERRLREADAQWRKGAGA